MLSPRWSLYTKHENGPKHHLDSDLALNGPPVAAEELLSLSCNGQFSVSKQEKFMGISLLRVSLKSECRNDCKSVNYVGTIGGGGWTESRDPMPIVNVSPNGPLCDPGTRSVTNNRYKKLKLETGLASFISPTPQSRKPNKSCLVSSRFREYFSTSVCKFRYF